MLMEQAAVRSLERVAALPLLGLQLQQLAFGAMPLWSWLAPQMELADIAGKP